MSLFAALLLSAAAQPTSRMAPPPPAQRRATNDWLLFSQFRAVCDKVGDYAAMGRTAAETGWRPVDDSADAQLARVNRIGREAVGTDGRYQIASFSQRAGERTWFLVVSRWEGPDGTWGNGCRMYDFAAAERIDPARLEQWIGRPPTGNQSFGTAGSNFTWEPGWREGMTVSVNHVPVTSPFVQRYGISGNVLVAQALGRP